MSKLEEKDKELTRLKTELQNITLGELEDHKTITLCLIDGESQYVLTNKGRRWLAELVRVGV